MRGARCDMGFKPVTACLGSQCLRATTEGQLPGPSIGWREREKIKALNAHLVLQEGNATCPADYLRRWRDFKLWSSFLKLPLRRYCPRASWSCRRRRGDEDDRCFYYRSITGPAMGRPSCSPSGNIHQSYAVLKGNSTDSPGTDYLGRLRHRRITTHSACIIHALLCPAELQGELNPLTVPRHCGMLCLTSRNTGALSEQMLWESTNQTHHHPAANASTPIPPSQEGLLSPASCLTIGYIPTNRK
ncbi:unnamed protein product [Lota lota]